MEASPVTTKVLGLNRDRMSVMSTLLMAIRNLQKPLLLAPEKVHENHLLNIRMFRISLCSFLEILIFLVKWT